MLLAAGSPLSATATATVTATPTAARFLSCSKGSSLFPFPTDTSAFSVGGRNRGVRTWHRLPSIDAKATTRVDNRTARHQRIRKKVEGTPERPRMCVFRSNKHLYVQVIDDTKMHTLASASTMQKSVAEGFDCSAGPTVEVATKIGEAIAKSCLEKGIRSVAFDRGGYPYHGRIKALADAAREHGLQF